MVKTVFGMPGAGDKSKGGDAVAPGGAPGATSGTGLPQKSGKEPGQVQKQETIKQAAAPEPSEPAKKPFKAPMAVPSTAKPVAPKPAGGKTVFGMPAMKIPIKPAEPPEPQEGTLPVAAQPAEPQERSTPVGLQAPDMAAFPAKGETVEAPAMTDDAYKATVAGMGAVTPSQIPPGDAGARPGQTTPQQAYDPSSAAPQDEDEDAKMKTMVAAQAAAPAATAPIQASSGQSVEEWTKAAKKPPVGIIFLFLGIIVVLLGIAGYLFFG